VSLESQLKAYAAIVDSRLNSLLPPPSQRPFKLHEAMRYSCLAPGKRLRPALCMVAAEAVGGTQEMALDAGCAVEMVHCFSLIHDDLPAIDNDDLRRGRPTCHKVYGEALAILAGDALFALAFQTLGGVGSEPSRVVRSLQCLTRAVGSDGLVGGEVEDVLAEGEALDAERLAFIHSRKTGALFSAACEIGGILGGGTDGQVLALREYGQHLGLAFQVADDLLNELSTVEALGKAAGSDREREKATYPALHGIDGARTEAYRQVELAVSSVRGLPARVGELESLARFAVERLS
jgi:geranylgeranyl diphosphate synthase type II